MGKTAKQKKMGIRGRIINFRYPRRVGKPMKAKPKRRQGVFYSTRMKSNNQPLRNLQVPPYPDIVKWSEARCNKVLKEANVLPKMQELRKTRCRHCGSKFTVTKASEPKPARSKKTNTKTVCKQKARKTIGKSKPAQKPKRHVLLRCRKKSRRKQINKAGIAFTPLWASASGGRPMASQSLVRSAYCVGLKLPQDAMKHLVGVSRKTI